MRVRDLTTEDLVAYAAYVSGKYNCAILRKSDTAEMPLIAEFLDALGYIGRDDFMQNYCTTLANRVYLNFTPGQPDVDLFAQLRVIAHEVTHVHQYQTSGLRFAWMYLSSPEERAVFESEAMRTELPLLWRYADTQMDTSAQVATLRAYGCSDEDLQTAKDLLDAAADITYRGGITSAVARDTIQWLTDRGVLS